MKPWRGALHDPDDLIRLFNGLFQKSEMTILDYGEGDPIYLAANDEREFNRILFANGFFASALHEISHWCIAGRERRRLNDYGYWYKPDGRSPEENLQFQRVESKSQGLEWIFSSAARKDFFVSPDNLKGRPQDLEDFRKAILKQALMYLGDMPPRAQIFLGGMLCLYESKCYFVDYWDEVKNSKRLPE